MFKKYHYYVNKIVEKIGEHNLPYVYCFLFLLTLFSAIAPMYYYHQNNIEKLKELDAMMDELDEVDKRNKAILKDLEDLQLKLDDIEYY